MRIYDNDGSRPGPPHDFYIATVNDHRWDQAQYEEGVDYDTDSYENYLNSHKIILQDFFNIDMDNDLVGKKVVESGGGCYPYVYSCKGLSRAVNIEPLFSQFPDQVKQRVEVDAGIECLSIPFESFEPEEKFDEAWFFNVLMHVKDPYDQLEKAQQIANTVRVFEPVNTAINIEHPHCFTHAWFEAQFPDTEIKRYVGGTVPGFHGANCSYFTWTSK